MADMFIDFYTSPHATAADNFSHAVITNLLLEFTCR